LDTGNSMGRTCRRKEYTGLATDSACAGGGEGTLPQVRNRAKAMRPQPSSTPTHILLDVVSDAVQHIQALLCDAVQDLVVDDDGGRLLQAGGQVSGCSARHHWAAATSLKSS